jgi:hypothetical protein
VAHCQIRVDGYAAWYQPGTYVLVVTEVHTVVQPEKLSVPVNIQADFRRFNSMAERVEHTQESDALAKRENGHVFRPEKSRHFGSQSARHYTAAHKTAYFCTCRFMSSSGTCSK